ncbi:MAG: DUF177 domain-containing protein [Trueperaceae bacterium]|nr:DUF177 domain-containing protein [Trueperaceae bacterium]
MQSRRDATLNLASLLHHAPGSDLEVEDEGSFTPREELLEADGLVLSGPLSWSIRVINAGGDDDFVVDGEIEGTAVMECRRCLKPAEVTLSTDFVYPMSYRPSEKPLMLDELSGEDDEERLVFGMPEVDFSELLTQLFAIEVPLTALCKEDCKGLNEDGVDLNEHPEAAKPPEPAVPNAPFSRLSEALNDLDLKS